MCCCRHFSANNFFFLRSSLLTVVSGISIRNNCQVGSLWCCRCRVEEASTLAPTPRLECGVVVRVCASAAPVVGAWHFFGGLALASDRSVQQLPRKDALPWAPVSWSSSSSAEKPRLSSSVPDSVHRPARAEADGHAEPRPKRAPKPSKHFAGLFKYR